MRRWGLQAASPRPDGEKTAPGLTGWAGVWPGQQVAAQKMSPRGCSNCKCQGKVKVSIVALVCDNF